VLNVVFGLAVLLSAPGWEADLYQASRWCICQTWLWIGRRRKKRQQQMKALKRWHVGHTAFKVQPSPQWMRVWAVSSKWCTATNWCIYFGCRHEKPPTVLVRGLEEDLCQLGVTTVGHSQWLISFVP